MNTADIIKLCLMLTSVALAVASLLMARRAARHARRAEAAYARVRQAARHVDAVTSTKLDKEILLSHPLGQDG